MASRTTKKKSRSSNKPYTRASTVSSQPISPVAASTSTHELPLPSGKPTTTSTCRAAYIELCKRYHPNVKPRNDWELFLLASTDAKLYGNTNEDFYAYLDKDFQVHHRRRFTDEEINDGRAHAQLEKEAAEILDMPGTLTGLKPSPGDNDDVHTCPIPNSDYSIRMWGTNMETNHEYCIDFIETATGKPINSPFKYELWAVPNKRMPWLPSPAQRLSSLERGFGVKEKDIHPGEEKFLLMEGTACILKRPGMQTVYFEVPVRPRPPADLDDLAQYQELDFGFSSMKRCGFCQCCKSIAKDGS